MVIKLRVKRTRANGKSRWETHRKFEDREEAFNYEDWLVSVDTRIEKTEIVIERTHRKPLPSRFGG